MFNHFIIHARIYQNGKIDYDQLKLSTDNESPRSISTIFWILILFNQTSSLIKLSGLPKMKTSFPTMFTWSERVCLATITRVTLGQLVAKNNGNLKLDGRPSSPGVAYARAQLTLRTESTKSHTNINSVKVERTWPQVPIERKNVLTSKDQELCLSLKTLPNQ